MVSPSPIVIGHSGNIPIIDFAPFIDGSRTQDVGDAMLESFKSIGFVVIVNHGMSQEKISNMFEWSKKFFHLPEDKKALAPHPPGGMPHRGWSAVGVEKVFRAEDYDEGKAEMAARDYKETFDLGRETDIYQPNIWLPDGVLDGFKEAALEFYWACNAAKFAILRALAVGLHIDEKFFDANHADSDCHLRMIRYPPIPAKLLDDPKVSRVSAHSDYGSITLLLQDDVGGLEVEDPNRPGSFIACSPVPGALIVNAGDFLQRWSNDEIRSSVHRVRAPPGTAGPDGLTPERFSIPFFCSPDMTKTVECLPGTFSEKKPKRYEPISAFKYLSERFAANY